MINLFRAEWKKAAGHRWLAGFLIWIFPVGAFATYLIAIIAVTVSDTAIADFGLDRALWTDVTDVWGMLSSYPGNVVGRMPILAFVAVLFAGEFEWGTWKNILPRNRRAALVLAKFITLGAYVVLSIAAMSLIIGLGTRIATAIAGLSYGPEPTTEAIVAFAGDYALSAGLAFASTIIVVAFAAFAALITKKIVGGIMIGFLISIIEPNTLLLFIGLGKLFRNPDLVNLHLYMPSYNIGNVNSWIQFNHALDMKPLMSVEASLGFSIALVALWVIGLIASVMILFQRQDITT